MQLTTTLTKQLKCYCLEISEIKTMKFNKMSHSMVSNQEDFTTPTKDISPKKQLDNVYRKRNESFYNKESLTAIWQFTSV